MLIHRLAAPIKRIMPGLVTRKLRSIIGMVIAPCRFMVASGNARSMCQLAAVDAAGNPLPWYTYPAIDALCAHDLTGRTVCEFGAGQSTLWWAERASNVVSFEGDQAWHNQLSHNVAQNVELHFVSDDSDRNFYSSILGKRAFDVIVIDGLNRYIAAEVALDHIAHGGCIIFDNSEGYWGPEKTYPIIDLLYKYGFSRIDYYGFAPSMISRHCTSIFFQHHCFLFTTNKPPKRLDIYNL